LRRTNAKRLEVDVRYTEDLNESLENQKTLTKIGYNPKYLNHKQYMLRKNGLSSLDINFLEKMESAMRQIQPEHRSNFQYQMQEVLSSFMRMYEKAEPFTLTIEVYISTPMESLGTDVTTTTSTLEDVKEMTIVTVVPKKHAGKTRKKQ